MSPAPQPLVELERLSLTPFRAAHPTLRNVTLTVRPGERIAVTGPSGSGKSTLGYLLAGIDALALAGAVTGRVSFDGAQAPKRPPPFTAMFLQRYRLQLRGTTIREHLATAAGLTDPRALQPWDDPVIEQLGLTDWLDQQIASLSSGWAARAALGGVFLRRPRLMVLDEPYAHLDGEGAERLTALLNQAQACAEQAIVILQHHTSVRESWVRRVITLQDGQLTSDAPHSCAPACPRPTQVNTAREAEHGPSVLEIRDLSFSFPQAAPIVDGFDFSIGHGQAVALLGPNGSGKSTLLALVKGLLQPARGTIRLGSGRCPFEAVGYVPAVPDDQLFASTVAEECGFMLAQQGLPKAECAARVQVTLAAMGLWGLRDHSPFSLSHGQKRRLAIASVLVSGPELLVLDEPAAGLDPDSLEVMAIALRTYLGQGGAILFATHQDELIQLLNARVQTLVAPRAHPVLDAPRRPGIELRPATRVLIFSAEIAAASLWHSAGALFALALAILGRLPSEVRGRWFRLVAALLLSTTPVAFAVMLSTGFDRIPIRVDCGPALAATATYIGRMAVLLAASAALALELAPETLLGLLRRVRFPRTTAYVAALALHVLPDVRHEVARVVLAQRARGSRMRSLTALLAIVVPIFAGHLRGAQDTALALELQPLSHERVLLGPFSFRDAAAIGTAVLVLCVGYALQL